MAFPSSWHVAWAARPTLDASPTRTAGRSTRHVTPWRASPRGPSAFDKGPWGAQDLRRRRTLIGRPLLTVSGFTTSLRAGEHGEVMVLTDQNRVVSLPRDPRSQSPAAQIAALLKRPDAREMPVVADASRALLSRAPGARGPMRLVIDGDPWWKDIEHRRDKGRSEQSVHSLLGWLVPLRSPPGQTCEPRGGSTSVPTPTSRPTTGGRPGP